jgi:hypothetical protein
MIDQSGSHKGISLLPSSRCFTGRGERRPKGVDVEPVDSQPIDRRPLILWVETTAEICGGGGL